VAVLNHKPTKMLQLSMSNLIASRKPDTRSLQLGRTYHRRRTLTEEDETAGKATGSHPGKYMIRETVSMQLHHSVV